MHFLKLLLKQQNTNAKVIAMKKDFWQINGNLFFICTKPKNKNWDAPIIFASGQMAYE